jgi:hypothetical protein
MFFQHASVSRTLTLSGMILSGTLLGFHWQRVADSGDLQMPKIMLTCAISAGSYLIAFLVVEKFKIRREGWHWVLSSFIGSVFSAFNIKVVKFLIANAQHPYAPSFLEQLDLIAFGFLVCAVFFSALSLLIVATIHLLGRSLERFFTW